MKVKTKYVQYHSSCLTGFNIPLSAVRIKSSKAGKNGTPSSVVAVTLRENNFSSTVTVETSITSMSISMSMSISR